jgi:carotenoid cleavage dioxygenase
VPKLDTIGPETYQGKLTSACTAHPKVDPVTGEMLFFGYSLFQPPYLKYSIVSPEGELIRTTPIDLPVSVMMHDFAITEHYTIFLDLPMEFRLERMQQGKPPLMFRRDRPSRFGILPRYGDNDSIRWFEAPSCYIFHTLNAYESGDEVVLLACRMSEVDVLGAADSPLPDESDLAQDDSGAPLLYRWRLQPQNGCRPQREIKRSLWRISPD